MVKKAKGRIFVISSPSGGGKTTVCNRLKKEGFDVKYSISATTRKPRKDEKKGRDYHFIKREEFKRMVRKNKFLEWEDGDEFLVYGMLFTKV